MKTSVTIKPSTETQTETLSPEVIEQAQQAVKQEVVLQPIVQPIVYQDASEQPIKWQTYTAEPLLAETITEAEKWAVQTIAQPLIAKGVKVYNDTIPPNEVRPREYVVLSVDDEVGDIDFSDNKNERTESLVTFIIQGQGNTFQNWVVEISNLIMDILRQERTKGKIRSVTNRTVGLDETTNLLSRIISVWYRFKN